jgi:hypothetical protein
MPENQDLFPADWTKPGGPRHRWRNVTGPMLMEECGHCDIVRFKNLRGDRWRYFFKGKGGAWTYKRPCCIHPELRENP